MRATSSFLFYNWMLALLIDEVGGQVLREESKHSLSFPWVICSFMLPEDANRAEVIKYELERCL